jgi:hypothetical protein
MMRRGSMWHCGLVAMCLAATACSAMRSAPPAKPDSAATAPAAAASPAADVAPSAALPPAVASTLAPEPVPVPPVAAPDRQPTPATPPRVTNRTPAAPPAQVPSSTAPTAPTAPRAVNEPPTSGAAPPAAIAPATPPAAAASGPPSSTLDFTSLGTRLRETKAIGVLTKISVKNQADDLLEKFRGYHKRQSAVTLADLRSSYELLVLKILSLVQDGDPPLAKEIDRSRAAIWDILADQRKFIESNLMSGA